MKVTRKTNHRIEFNQKKSMAELESVSRHYRVSRPYARAYTREGGIDAEIGGGC